MSKIPLSFNETDGRSENAGANGATEGAPGAQTAQTAPAGAKTPVMGWAAVGFGLLGIFTIGFVFVPLGLICSVVALFMGQVVWGVVGLMLAVAGFVTSPKLWLIIGMSAFWAMFDIDEWLKPLMDFLNSIGIGETTEV